MSEDANISKDVFSQMEGYNTSNLPDDPIVSTGTMIDAMISNDEFPEDMRNKYPWIFNKDNVLGFLDEQRKREKLLNFDIIKLDFLTTIPRRDFKFETELQMDTLRNIFETKLDRSVGSPNASSMMNERKSLISQISENRNVQESDDGLVKEGFIRKLMGSKGKR